MPVLKKILKKPAAAAVLKKILKKPPVLKKILKNCPEAGRGKQSGTGIVTLTSKDGQKLLEKHKLNTLSLDQKLELLRLNLITEKDVSTDKKHMTALWNRFRDARKVHGGEFQENWDSIAKLKDATPKKHLSLFSWVRFRGFNKHMLKKTNALEQGEDTCKGEHMMEFNELCSKLALNPLKKSSRTFIDQGIAKGKYKKIENPNVPDEYLYTLTSFARIQTMSRKRSQQLTQELEPSTELALRFRQVVAQPLAGLTDGTASIARESHKKRPRLAIADAVPEPEDQEDDTEDNDHNEEPSMRPHLLHQHGQVCLNNGRPATWLGGQ
jgi:hypothetical protein